MHTPIVTQICIYPVKSLGGISVPEAVVEERGFRYDRRWMLVAPDSNGGPGRFLTQRSYTVMALIDVSLTDTGLLIRHRHRPDEVLEVPFTATTGEPVAVTIWQDTVPAVAVSAEADRWFSRVMGLPCRLVHMPDTTRRLVDQDYARPDDVVSFADAYPFLVIGQATLDELNRRLEEPLSMVRFRPNLVVEGGLPHEEDTWYRFRIGSLDFFGLKPCARCVLTTVDPATGQKGREPLRTLMTYRQLNHKIYFGQNALPVAVPPGSTLRVGDAIDVLERRPARLPF